ncbi:hypothetical protein BY996DRAFT_6411946 [Phakopsora pachyrhizi]|uniref:Expressed protein n=1 Tax=Phakopsora pachyrhizi TaxID=170000 RepID=A0AAV0AWP8_PHAPC|nr:hypothetical protein BY996DRAFT_6411946 [Phakopsora pachyrhizi]CAH7674289.1 expressed protein [Phakopsora pachyrhizi]
MNTDNSLLANDFDLSKPCPVPSTVNHSNGSGVPTLLANRKREHIHNSKLVSVPPPLALVPQDRLSRHSSSSSLDQDHVMTARCSQFPMPPHIDPPQPTPSPINQSCRFQPYPHLLSAALDHSKPSLNSACPPNLATNDLHLPPSHHQLVNPGTNPGTPGSSNGLAALVTNCSTSPSLPLDSPLSSSDLNSSCSSSLASGAHPTGAHQGYFPIFNNDPTSQALSSAAPHPPLASRNRSDSAVYPIPPTAYNQAPSYRGYQPLQLGSQRLSLSLAYPTAAFTPSGGSPPLTSSSVASPLFHVDGAGRRHTLSSFASPSSIELGLVGNLDLDESYIKEEKRRRNKESSQRFRDRTRERQREKQERLEYLERRLKELEADLAVARARSSNDEGQAIREEQEMVEVLRRENENLRSALKHADDEIHRLREAAGGPGSRQESSQSPFDIRQVYSSLAQLSPPASNGIGPGSQSSSPPSESNPLQQGGSPDSDLHPNHHIGLGSQSQLCYQIDAGQAPYQLSNTNEFGWAVDRSN